MPKKRALYEDLIVRIFNNHYKKGLDAFEFVRTEIETVAAELGLQLPKNLGDLIYSFRYRKAFPQEIVATEIGKKKWIILQSRTRQVSFQAGKAHSNRSEAESDCHEDP